MTQSDVPKKGRHMTGTIRKQVFRPSFFRRPGTEATDTGQGLEVRKRRRRPLSTITLSLNCNFFNRKMPMTRTGMSINLFTLDNRNNFRNFNLLFNSTTRKEAAASLLMIFLEFLDPKTEGRPHRKAL